MSWSLVISSFFMHEKTGVLANVGFMKGRGYEEHDIDTSLPEKGRRSKTGKGGDRWTGGGLPHPQSARLPTGEIACFG